MFSLCTQERGQSVLLPAHRKDSKQFTEELLEQTTQIGAIVKLKWLVDESKDTKRKGWYNVTVKSHHNETDMLTITHTSEPGKPYEYNYTYRW